MLALFFLISSLVVLVLGASAWYLTDSGSVCANTVFGSFALLFGAHQAYSGVNLEWTVMIAFFVTMILGGRALGTWIRSRRENALRRPAHLLLAAAGMTCGVTVAAFCSL